ncbi:NAD-dependent epimerase/dehydratase family protein [Helicobacter kayseriensis]|uniref:NAD-dependent epimerase/dehydratase family protein n=1 Tax=Helicobacter kayseriensis TaxID=2905877 RepID=UPI001E612044|nr:NAD(P)-dependent oxidoreductase [Helicobacter kayseriensis]MCE3046979.1 NAD(P)-dependent oxidoreductase [Helicobacter kayseriensis]MCE3048361.1 NAD(P)-dependent oxidoreductase [Helicobacter kayseriensis]
MRFVLVGGSGFVGQYAFRALRDAYPQCEILVLDKVNNFLGDAHPYIELDLTKDIDFQFRSTDIVIHLAARQYHPKPPKKDRDEYFFELNFYGTKRLIEKMAQDGCHRMIYFSTDMVYGIPKHIPLTESHPTHPFGPYGRSKLASEELLQQYWKEGFKITIFRPRMIVGKGRFGLLTKLFWLIDHHLPVPMIGNGKNCYQMVSVEDCATAIVCAIKSEIPNVCCNLGSKNPPSVKELLSDLIAYVGSRSILIPTWGDGIKVILKTLGAVGVELMFEEQYQIADQEYIVDLEGTYKSIGWSPRFSDEEMLRLAYAEYRS